jgi:hypothetical protein
MASSRPCTTDRVLLNQHIIGRQHSFDPLYFILAFPSTGRLLNYIANTTVAQSGQLLGLLAAH